MIKRIFACLSILLCTGMYSLHAQQKTEKEYPALLWEITGNGLKKPSYLFGTMHVSNKLAFHLSDSFYNALKSVDAVALELNPEIWQPEMIRLNMLNENYRKFTADAGTDYFTENNFKITDYADKLKTALSTEPPVVNSLLYRSYTQSQDFEEDTFLDLYIYQTARKLGKQPAGVENYYESEKLVLEAYMDMAREKHKNDVDYAGETQGTLSEKLQNAYRQGDLDLMDSINNVLENSPAFKEKFLYKRNEIQAASIDTIVQRRSLFVGVGAAHLPGNRGVINLLRKKGYTLRPIKMTERDAQQKAQLEKLNVPVVFRKQYANDSSYTVEVPGELYSLRTQVPGLDSWQYADMNNGSYYMVTRIKTYSNFLQETKEKVLFKIDSLLYENVPGKIISTSSVEKNGYEGLQIENRTRTGNLQRSQVYITPFEIVMFKMSGKEDYVAGKEATTFFNSISFNKNEGLYATDNKLNGVRIDMPGEKHLSQNTAVNDRWEYEISGNDAPYILFKTSIYNYDFLAQDSFDINLMHESFIRSESVKENLSKTWGEFKGMKALFATDSLKQGGYAQSMYFLYGPDYYAFIKRVNKKADLGFAFTKNLSIVPYTYKKAETLVDNYLKFKVNTPVAPVLDKGIRELLEQSIQDANDGNSASGNISYWHTPRYASYKDASTGQMVSVKIQDYPKYYSIRDTEKYWNDLIKDFSTDDLTLLEKTPIDLPGAKGYKVILTDTGTTRKLQRMLILKNDKLYTLSTMLGNGDEVNLLKNNFFNSFEPAGVNESFNNTANKIDQFFADFKNPDSAVNTLPRKSIANIYFKSSDAPKIVDAINYVNLDMKDYFEMKTKLITELGYLTEGERNDVPAMLENVYRATADTSVFQNAALFALGRLKTKKSFSTLLGIMLQDPPVFEDNGDYSNLIGFMSDTLQLAKSFVKDLITFTTLEDYKSPVNDLIVELVDSNYISKKEYKKYYKQLYVDARVALKKQLIKDENSMQEEIKALQNPEDAEDDNDDYDNNSYDNSYGLFDYAVLLMPYYDKDKNVQQFFDKLLNVRNKNLLLSTSILLLKNKKQVPADVWEEIGSEEKYIGKMYDELTNIGRADIFPASYKNQEIIARSILLESGRFKKVSAIELVGIDTTVHENIANRVYYFKYKVKSTDEWKMGISGVQPLNPGDVIYDDTYTSLTDKRLLESEPVMKQFRNELQKLIFADSKSGKYFFEDDSKYGDYGDY